MKPKVLLLEKINSLAKEQLEEKGFEVQEIPRALDEKELLKEIKDLHYIGIRSKTEITKKILENAGNLLGIGAFCIGTNQIDLAAATKKGVSVFNAPFSSTRSVAEMAIGEIIVLNRKVIQHNYNMHQGVWEKSTNGCYEFRNKVLGIIGYGNIGKQIANLAEDLGMQVQYFDIRDTDMIGNLHKCKSMEELLKTSDYITIHVDGHPNNKNLIGDKEFELMKDGVIFLNLSRGFVVDINALVKNIKSGKIRGAAIDVYPVEPKSNTKKFISKLQDLPNVVLTPHIAGNTCEAQEEIGRFVSDKIITYTESGITDLSVNLPNIQVSPKGELVRIIHIHENKAGILSQINEIFGSYKINVERQHVVTNSEVGYAITDIIKYKKGVIKELEDIKGTIKVRKL